MADDDFAAMLEASFAGDSAAAQRTLKKGQRVQALVVAVGAEFVFVDVGTKSEGRIARREFEDDDGTVKVAVGDKIHGTVAAPDDPEGPLVVTALGRGGMDVETLALAAETGAPVEGTVSGANKGGLEVRVGSIRAFCPASQIELTYAGDLEAFVGHTYSFKVMEVRDKGRSVVLSRRAVLAEERDRQASTLADGLSVGDEFDGVVDAVKPYGAFIDIGGLRGLAHVSELAHGRVARPEDVVSVGDNVRVKVLSVEAAASGKVRDMKVSLSMKALTQPPPQARVGADEVLTATIDKIEGFGLLVTTPAGSGLVPTRELGIPQGSDARRAFNVGDEVTVVATGKDGQGRPRYSIGQVAEAEARRNFRAFKESGGSGRSLGSLGDLLQGIEVPDRAPEAQPPRAAPVAEPPPKPRTGRRKKIE